MPPISEKAIILLVGPKGTGKSYIGDKLSQLFDAHFLQIEKIWQKIKAEDATISSPTYIAEGIKRSLRAVADDLSLHNFVIIESTGAFEEFLSYLVSLQSMAKVYLVNIESPLEKCLQRIQTRDQSLHVPVSDDKIKDINIIAQTIKLDWDIVIMNDPFVSEDKIREIFSKLLRPRI